MRTLGTTQLSGSGVAVPVVVASTVICITKVAAAKTSAGGAVGVTRNGVQVAVGVGSWMGVLLTVAVAVTGKVDVSVMVSVIGCDGASAAAWAYSGSGANGFVYRRPLFASVKRTIGPPMSRNSSKR